jgi:dinuclear metal center YbgI/SA1388 family protein
VGLLLGDRDAEVSRAVTCLTLTPDVAVEAVQLGAQLVVTHHPVLFKPVQRLTSDTVEGRTLLLLLKQGVAVYSPHTAWDNAPQGINRQLAERLELTDIRPLRPFPNESEGAGRYGCLTQPVTLSELVHRVQQRLPAERVEVVGDPALMVQQVGIACGSAAEFWRDAQQCGCQVLLTGEARFHAALEVRDAGFAMILAGHYATERPGMERLAELLAAACPGVTVTPSAVERDPLS